MNPRWFREYALPECSYRAASLADRGAAFMCIAGRVRPLWAPYCCCGVAGMEPPAGILACRAA
eukprot:4730679-Pyramimonas_sp.AAC.1